MAEQILITITDVQTYRNVDPKFNTTRFNAFMMEVQRTNLRGLLGDALYLDFFANLSATKYTDLLNGKDYTYNGQTIKCYGLKPVLVYWWLAIATREGELFLSNHGAVQFVNNPQQNFESAKEKERIAAGYMETAQGYANDIIKFINQNINTYPLFENKIEQNKTNFISFRV